MFDQCDGTELREYLTAKLIVYYYRCAGKYIDLQKNIVPATNLCLSVLKGEVYSPKHATLP